MAKTDKITVTKGGSILGIGRYTEIPFRALGQAEFNMMCPKEAKKVVCEAKRSDSKDL